VKARNRKTTRNRTGEAERVIPGKDERRAINAAFDSLEAENWTLSDLINPAHETITDPFLSLADSVICQHFWNLKQLRKALLEGAPVSERDPGERDDARLAADAAAVLRALNERDLVSEETKFAISFCTDVLARAVTRKGADDDAAAEVRA
jgi:hypothetical protein